MSLDVFNYGAQCWDFSKAETRPNSERVKFAAKHLPSFDSIDPKTPNNKGYHFEMFTVLTQHLKGHTIQDLLDAGVYIDRHGPSKSKASMDNFSKWWSQAK